MFLRKNRKRFDGRVLDFVRWTGAQDGAQARLVEHPDGDPSERFVLCRSNARAAKLIEAVSTIRSMDVVVPVKRAGHTMDLVVPVKRAAGAIKLRLRTLAKPDEDVAVLLAHLGLKLPKGSKLAQNVVEKNH